LLLLLLLLLLLMMLVLLYYSSKLHVQQYIINWNCHCYSTYVCHQLTGVFLLQCFF
jgi:hypothetical protein